MLTDPLESLFFCLQSIDFIVAKLSFSWRTLLACRFGLMEYGNMSAVPFSSRKESHISPKNGHLKVGAFSPKKKKKPKNQKKTRRF
jgi:hypothetical protein